MLEEQTLASGMTVHTARPDTSEKRPAVIFLHERYGIVQHTRDLGERLARDGYVACLPDLFHRFDGDREALALGEERVDLRDEESLADLDDAVAFLRQQSYVDGDQIGVVGVCQSGREPLLYAAHRHDVPSVVVMYGGVGAGGWEPKEGQPTPVSEFIERLRCPVLGLFGEADHVVSVADVSRFRAAMEDSRKSYRIRVYADAPHGWLNDTMPGRYRPETTEASWSELIGFLGETLGGDWDRTRVTWSYACDTAADYDFSKNRRLE